MIVKKTLSEQIYSMLKKDILTGKIIEGDKLVNKDLQEKYGVSSSPIRDAINKLNSDGLISKINRTGAQVIEIDYKKIKEINELMTTITCGTIWLCKNKDVKSVELTSKLKKIADLQYENLYTDKYFYYDYCFHKIFFDCSDNLELKKIYNQYSALFEMAVRTIHRNDDNNNIRKKAYQEHLKIIECIETGSLEIINERIMKHYNSASNLFKKLDNKEIFN